MASRRRQVVVVGAGAAGLTAARLVSPWADVVVLDKGRGVGGRMATRRIGAATFDHGAQFVTTHTPEFAATVESWAAAGVASAWYRGQVGAEGLGARDDGHVRWRGTQSMNAVAKHLADGLDVRRGVRIAAVRSSGSGAGAAAGAQAMGGDVPAWQLAADDGTVFAADAVLLTAPVPQTLEMLDAGAVRLDAADRDALDAVVYEPTIAAMLTLAAPAGLPEPGAVAPAAGPVAWMADNQAKGVSAQPAVTIHADPAFSAARWGDDPVAVARDLAVAAGFGAATLAEPAQVHRWRYARPVTTHPARALALTGCAPAVCAGDAFGGPKVEGAVNSGVAAAALLADLMTSG